MKNLPAVACWLSASSFLPPVCPSFSVRLILSDMVSLAAWALEDVRMEEYRTQQNQMTSPKILAESIEGLLVGSRAWKVLAVKFPALPGNRERVKMITTVFQSLI